MMQEIMVDSFAGGGGASLGIHWATGQSPDIAINHDAAAILMHAENHKETEHFTEDVWKVDPRQVTKGRPVGLLWASPDCKHFSRAKGSQPVEKKIRSLAWVVIKWAAEVQPRMIFLENVREFEDWGPLVPRWACSECDWKGTHGQAKLLRRRAACPRCESHQLGETTDMIPDPARKGLTFRRWKSRLKRLGYAVETKVLNAADYGAPTHRRRLFLIARRDGQPIVWPAASHGDPKKIGLDLFTRTLQPWRTASECIDWSIQCPSIFTRKRPLAEATMRRIALGMKRYVLETATPFIVGAGGPAYAGAPRPVDRPFGTVLPKNSSRLIAAHITPLTHQGERRGSSPDQPLPTVTGAHRGEQALVAAFLAKHFGGSVGVPIDTPLPTTTVRGTQNQIAVANVIHMNHGEKQWSGVDEPMRTLTTNNHARLVYSFLVKYFGTAIGQAVDAPLHTVTSKDRFGLVTVMVDGEPYVIVDIGMRMLTPRELARGQGFPDSYVLTGNNTSQVAGIGNSVCPVMAEVLVRANYASQEKKRAA